MVALPVSGLRPLWPLHGHGLPGLVAVEFQTKVWYVLNCQPVHGLRAARDGGHVDRHPVAIGHRYVCHLSEGPFGFLVTSSQLFRFNNFLRSNVYFPITFLFLKRGECLVARLFNLLFYSTVLCTNSRKATIHFAIYFSPFDFFIDMLCVSLA